MKEQGSFSVRPYSHLGKLCMTLLIFTSPSGLFASHVATTMQVSARVVSSCLINAETLNFGNYDPAAAHAKSPLHVKSALTIKCTNNTTANISIDTGMHAAKSAKTSRALANAQGSDFLGYELYKDEGYSDTWNKTNPFTYAATNGASKTINVYGAIPANQGVHDGVYSDTVTLVATF